MKSVEERPGSASAISTLRECEGQFLEVLLSRFELHRNDNGVELGVSLRNDSPCITNRAGVNEARRGNGFHPDHTSHWEQRVRSVQAGLDAFLSGKTEQPEYVYDDASFRFRFLSGGVLLIAAVEGKQYFCLRWRDIEPIGWNLANGGSDSRLEMVDPVRIIERELREEMLVVDPRREHGVRYQFSTGASRAGTPEQEEEAWRMWESRFRADPCAADAFTIEELPLLWIHGPDSLRVDSEQIRPGHISRPRPTDGYFLNINAEDFGIELDKMARIHLPRGAVLCDGELTHGSLLNSPIGLFEVGSFRARFESGQGTANWEPDLLFFDGKRWPTTRLREVLSLFLQHKKDVGLLDPTADTSAPQQPLGLCPATRSLIQRWCSLPQEQPSSQPGSGDPAQGADYPYDIFISFASEARALAQRIFQHLLETGRGKPFFSPESIRVADFSTEIDKALGSAQVLLSVGMVPAHFEKRWPYYEWQSYSNEFLGGRKTVGQIITIVAPGIHPSDLPYRLRNSSQMIQFDPTNPEKALQELERFLPE